MAVLASQCSCFLLFSYMFFVGTCYTYFLFQYSCMSYVTTYPYLQQAVCINPVTYSLVIFYDGHNSASSLL